MLDQDNNFYLISMSILISCLLYVYYRERLQVSHFWELKGWLILFWTVPFVDCYWNRTLLCSHLPHWYKGTSKMSESRNHHNESYGKTGNKKDISFSNNGHTKTYFCVRKADNTVELKAARLCDCFFVLHLIYLLIWTGLEVSLRDQRDRGMVHTLSKATFYSLWSLSRYFAESSWNSHWRVWSRRCQ